MPFHSVCQPSGHLDLTFLEILQDVISAGDADVLLGRDVGAPPLPAAATVRLGLLDVVNNLQLLVKAGGYTAAAFDDIAEDVATPLSTSFGEAAAPSDLGAAAAAAGSGLGLVQGKVDTDETSASMPGVAQPRQSAATTGETGAAEVLGETVEAAAGPGPAAAAEAFNHTAAALWPDYYYDLSTAHTSHLEVPLRLPQAAGAAAAGVAGATASAAATGFGEAPARSRLPEPFQARATARVEPQAQQQSVGQLASSAGVEGFKQLSKGLEGLLHGVPFLRQLVPPLKHRLQSAQVEDVLPASALAYTLEPSIHRGGSTFILNPQALLVPQTSFPARRWVKNILTCIVILFRKT